MPVFPGFFEIIRAFLYNNSKILSMIASVCAELKLFTLTYSEALNISKLSIFDKIR